MITVTIVRQSADDKRIVSFAIEGHAKFANPAKISSVLVYQLFRLVQSTLLKRWQALSFQLQ